MEINMSDKIEVIMLPASAINGLEALESALQGQVDDGKVNPALAILSDFHDVQDGNIGFYTHDNKVLALSLHHCGLTVLPESILHFTDLEQLDLTGNQLAELLPALGNLRNLKTIYLVQNRLTSLPDSIGNLTQL